MAVTARAQSALSLDPSAWTIRPAGPRGRQSWPWAAAGVGGAAVLVAAIVALTMTLGTSSVSGNAIRTGATSRPTADPAALRGEYASLVSSYVNAERSWTARAGRVVPGSTASAEALIRPTVQFADTVDQVDRDLARLPWPGALRGDADALEGELARVSGDLRSIGAQTVSSMSAWKSKVVADAAQWTTSGDRFMRHLETTTEASGPRGLRPSAAEG